MEICEAFGLSVWPFDPMLKSSGVQGLPRGSQMHVLPPHQGWGGLHQKSWTGLDLCAQAAYWPSSQSPWLATLAT